jgi:nucleotide-binding universal stress UspA family protein
MVAAPLARTLHGVVILVRVVQPPLQPATPLAPALDVESEILTDMIARANAYLAQVAQGLDQAGVQHEKVMLVGYPAEMILDAVHSCRADAVVLCTHGRTGLLRWALGSVAQRIVHQAAVPVLVLPIQGPLPVPGEQRPLRGLVPLDGSWLAEAALGPAATLMSALAPQGRGSIHLVQVIRPTSVEAEAREAALEAQDYLRRMAEHLKRGPLASLQVQVTWSALREKDIAGALVNLAEARQTARGAGNAGRFDVIAMGTHGRGGLHRWVMGSITERVLSAAQLPMLVVRPKEVVVTSRVDATTSQSETSTETQKGLQHA